jgi:hypothetical protein
MKTSLSRSIWSLRMHSSSLLTPKAGLGDDSDHVPKAFGRVILDRLLLRPRQVARSKQAPRITGNSTPVQGFAGHSFFFTATLKMRRSTRNS